MLLQGRQSVLHRQGQVEREGMRGGEHQGRMHAARHVQRLQQKPDEMVVRVGAVMTEESERAL